MAFKYWLPNEQNQKQEFTTDSNSIIIIGANGAGKSKLGAWMEQQDYTQVHRIGAQRNLNFNENIPLKNYSQAEDFVFWGIDQGEKNSKGYRWGWSQEDYTTKLIDDFENVLAALLALKNNENDKFVEECKISENMGRQKPNTPFTSIDMLISIWNNVFPQRQLLIEDSKFYATINKDGEIKKYSANQMSDGERAVLYLASQVLCVPKDKTMIIDEPEIHLHRSIMNRLWISLEKCRTDCLFIYITHDTQFAALHAHTDKIWIREFDGDKWKFKKIIDNTLPEELLLEVLGSRKNVIFVEGDKSSYDTQLYTAIFPNYYIIPCGSCSQVIERTKAFKNNPSLHECMVYGIIDRDYRSEYEIKKNKEDNIFTLNVAEVENLFITEELICLMAEHMGKTPEEVFTSVKEYVINTRFANQISKQICQSIVAQIKFCLASIEISSKNDEEARNSLDSAIKSIDYDEIKSKEETRFRKALSDQNYKNVIRIFNEKNLTKSIGQYLDIKNDSYCSTVISLLNGKLNDNIINAILPYIPTEIQR